MSRKPIFTLLVCTLLFVSPVMGQTTQTLTQGIESNFLVAPDYKFTEVNGEFAGLAGLYGGWLINQKFLIGGAAYFQTNGGNDSDMKYGGALLEYFFNPTRVANISVRGLVGGGTANLRLFGFPGLPLRGGFPGRGRFGPSDLDLGDIDLGKINLDELTRRFGGRFPFDDIDLNRGFDVEETFLVMEPEVNVTLNVTERFRIGLGGGYRFIGAAGGFDDRLEGFSANAAAQFRF